MNTLKLWITAFGNLAIGAAAAAAAILPQNQKDKVYNAGILQLVEHPAWTPPINSLLLDGLAETRKGFAGGNRQERA